MRDRSASGFLCPKCRSHTKPLEVRQSASGLRRRRRCVSCGYALRTYELEHVGLGVADPVLIDRKVLIGLANLLGRAEDIKCALELASSVGASLQPKDET
jgi:Zn ribbon nucleic-acid-binding protein